MVAMECASSAPASAKADVSGLWQDYFNGRSEAARNRLVENYIPMVRYVAERIWLGLPKKQVDCEDLVSAGVFGLMQAIAAYDPGRGTKFNTYAPPRIRGHMLDWLRDTDWVPRLTRTRAKLVDRARGQLFAELRRPPTNAEIAGRLKIPRKLVNKVMSDSAPVKISSISKRLRSHTNDSKDEIGNLLTDDRTPNPVQIASESEWWARICVGFARDEQLILILYFREAMTMKEIGRVLELSESRISQIYTSIVMRLRAKFTENQLATGVN